MKIDRMLGIVTYLLRYGHATAPELAERFEVSRRTIQRDIEHICAAGIPLITAQGSGGGISIQPGYRVSDALLTQNELRAILAGVAAMDSVSSQRHAKALADKLAHQEERDWICIDLSHGAELFETVKEALLNCTALEITYCYTKGEVQRVIEPHQLVHKWGSWYLIAWCRLRQDFRLFRLERIRAASRLEESFVRREIPHGMLLPDPDEPPCRLTALYAPEPRYRLLEVHAYDLSEKEDGRLQATCSFASEGLRLSWALGFGDRIEVLFPEEVRKEIVRQAKHILEREKKC